jgi:protoporphyrinogen oxidase
VHCLFSHFEFFDALLDNMLPPKDWLYHQRYSPARMRNTWVGYPVQSNLWRLPEAEVIGIVSDLAVKALQPPPQAASLRNFLDWLEAGFGKALTKSFMAPYNAKVWAHPPDEMNLIWVGERVATIKFSDILRNVINRQDAPAWGPNAQFRYPLNGTGLIWEKVFDGLPRARKRLNARVARVRTKEGEKAVELTDGTSVKFDALLSTIPIVQLLRMTPDHPELASLAEGDNGAADKSRFKHQTVNLVGVGIWGIALPEALNGVHWVYFPEDEYIFYRVTVLSNFSPLVVAHPYKQWSLLIEARAQPSALAPRPPSAARPAS